MPAPSPMSSPTIKKMGSVSHCRSSHLPENIPIRMEPTNWETIADIKAIACNGWRLFFRMLIASSLSENVNRVVCKHVGNTVENCRNSDENPIILHPLLAYNRHLVKSMEFSELSHKQFPKAFSHENLIYTLIVVDFLSIF